ncbi:unnamed protein product, partial [Rodentolepis nana]|uniref:B30.2/SPRY domain-containing protein n=1 Tax=Rodentolepis nana TaxID=102285 RepID=A0A0R3TBI4_RODNA
VSTSSFFLSLLSTSKYGYSIVFPNISLGVKGDGRFYYEARVVESNGLARIGWTTEDGSLLVGTDAFGFGYGSDIDNYGESFGEGDVIGCFLDLTQRTIRWAKNGHPFGDAYHLPDNFATVLASNGSPVARRIAFFPTVALNNSTVELNFGDSQFSYFPGVYLLRYSYH